MLQHTQPAPTQSHSTLQTSQSHEDTLSQTRTLESLPTDLLNNIASFCVEKLPPATNADITNLAKCSRKLSEALHTPYQGERSIFGHIEALKTRHERHKAALNEMMANNIEAELQELQNAQPLIFFNVPFLMVNYYVPPRDPANA